MSVTLGVSEQVKAYVQKWGIREHPALARCRAETNSDPQGMMQISPEQGAFMQVMARTIGARRAVEVGVFTGYSSTAVALAMKAVHGKAALLIACDISAEFIDRARGYWRQADVQDVIETRIGPAADSLRALRDGGCAGTLDLMFIDADKPGYDAYYDLGLELLRPGGLMLIDNMLWSGAVAEPENRDADTVALRALAAKIASDERIDMTLATIGDGLSIILKR